MSTMVNDNWLLVLAGDPEQQSEKMIVARQHLG